MHYAIINSGGESPNVVQAEARVKYLIRSTSAAKVKKLYERVCDVAQGARFDHGNERWILFLMRAFMTRCRTFALEDVSEGVLSEDRSSGIHEGGAGVREEI